MLGLLPKKHLNTLKHFKTKQTHGNNEKLSLAKQFNNYSQDQKKEIAMARCDLMRCDSTGNYNVIVNH